MRKFSLGMVVAIMGLSACTAQQAAVTAAGSEATQVVKNAHDDQLKAEVLLICGTPYSAILRNAGTIPGLTSAITSLCGNSATQAGAVLLNAVPVPSVSIQPTK